MPVPGVWLATPLHVLAFSYFKPLIDAGQRSQRHTRASCIPQADASCISSGNSSRAEKRGFFSSKHHGILLLILSRKALSCIITALFTSAPAMKFLFDLFPVILFFGAYSISRDIYIATGTAIAATFAQVIYSWVRHRKVDAMLWVSLVLISVLGGATLIFHNKTFILWKPTALYWFFACALLGGKWVKDINLIEKMMGAQISLPQPVWQRLLRAWVAFFAIMGVLNLFVAFQFSEDIWVNFKVFGTLILTLIFVILQSVYLARFIEPNKNNGPQV